MGQVAAKMALRCPTWRQDVPKMANLEAKMANLAHFLGASWRLVLDLGRDLAKNGENQKNDDSTALLKFFGVLGLLSEAMLAHLGAMLGYVGPSGRHLGATWRQDEAQERQDEPRWRTGAPRRGKIAELRRRELSQGGRGPRKE